MKIIPIRENIFLVDAPGPASNVAYFKTEVGVVIMDTTTTVENMQAVLDLAGLSPEEVCLVINTHADGDHIGGNTLFDCPILAHEKTLKRMKKAGRKANELPTKTISDSRHHTEVGGLTIELIYTGGHKPDQTMLWLPAEKVLLTSDLVFQGRYPFMQSSDVPTWISELKKLDSYDADAIFPGHGTLCTQEDIELLIAYMENTWALTGKHVKQGDNLKTTLADPAFKRPLGWIREQLFEKNIEVMYEQLSSA